MKILKKLIKKCQGEQEEQPDEEEQQQAEPSQKFELKPVATQGE